MPTKTIAVHGATGSQGAPVVAALTAAGHAVRPVSRAAGTDLLDRRSLEAAYARADAVVLQLPLVYDARALEMADNAARAAEVAGVPHLVINAGCALPPEPIGVPFLDARRRAAAAQVERVTLLEPTRLYLENISAPWSGGDGVIAYPLPGDVPLAWVATDDVAGAVVRAIEASVAGRYALPGVTATGDEVAAALGARWQPITPDEFADRLRPHLGDHAADGTAAVYRMAAPAPTPDAAPAREALGWAPRSIEDWAALVKSRASRQVLA
jgi:nucleoside-diphosphate-sugar epimerase